MCYFNPKQDKEHLQPCCMGVTPSFLSCQIPVQICIFDVVRQQTFHTQSLTTTSSTATGFASTVKVQVRVSEQEIPQFSRLASLAGLTPPMTEAELHNAEQKQTRSQSRREGPHSKMDVASK